MQDKIVKLLGFDLDYFWGKSIVEIMAIKVI